MDGFDGLVIENADGASVTNNDYMDVEGRSWTNTFMPREIKETFQNALLVSRYTELQNAGLSESQIQSQLQKDADRSLHAGAAVPNINRQGWKSQSTHTGLKIAQARQSGRPGAVGRALFNHAKELVKNDRTLVRGKTRSNLYSSNWKPASLKKAVDKFIGSNPVVTVEGGKRIYQNSSSPIKLVEDIGGRYFRIEDSSIKGKRRYMNLDGVIPMNKTLESGKQKGISRSEFQSLTHFKIEE